MKPELESLKNIFCSSRTVLTQSESNDERLTKASHITE